MIDGLYLTEKNRLIVGRVIEKIENGECFKKDIEELSPDGERNIAIEIVTLHAAQEKATSALEVLLELTMGRFSNDEHTHLLKKCLKACAKKGNERIRQTNILIEHSAKNGIPLNIGAALVEGATNGAVMVIELLLSKSTEIGDDLLVSCIRSAAQGYEADAVKYFMTILKNRGTELKERDLEQIGKDLISADMGSQISLFLECAKSKSIRNTLLIKSMSMANAGEAIKALMEASPIDKNTLYIAYHALVNEGKELTEKNKRKLDLIWEKAKSLKLEKEEVWECATVGRGNSEWDREVVKTGIRNGINPNARNSNGYTAIQEHFGLWGFCDFTYLNELVELGADPLLVGPNGEEAERMGNDVNREKVNEWLAHQRVKREGAELDGEVRDNAKIGIKRRI